MTFHDEQDYRVWIALVLAEQQQMAKAREIAAMTAFDDLPRNEQRAYLAHALTALKAKEFAS